MYDIAGTRQASRISRGETSGYPAINHALVGDNGMLHSGASIHLTPTNKMRRMKVNVKNIGNKDFAGIARSIRRNTSVLPVIIIIISIGFVILILIVLVLKTMW